MRENPLSLALVVVVFALSAMLYYSSAATLEQRSVMAKMIIEWQQQQQIILGGCVSADVTKTMLDNMQRITDTMLTFNNAEIKRMQESLDRERDRSFRLRELRELELQKQIPTPPQPEKQGLPKWLPLDGVEWQIPTVQAFPEHELFVMPP
jgi:tRNA A37 methylthiotransferase MiaB